MADVLYAARGAADTTSDLYTVNPATATPTSVGATGFALTGLAADPTTGILYGATSPNSSANPKSLVSIDTTTGAGTLIGSFGGKTLPDIGFNSAGQLFGWSASDKKVVTVNKASGAVSLLGASGLGASFGNGMDLNSSDVLYICPTGTDGPLYTANTSTGVVTSTGSMNDSGLADPAEAVNAGSFSPTDVFWAVYKEIHLATLDVTTRVWTEVGSLGGASSWDALAWSVTGGGGGGGGGTGAQPEGVSIAFNDPALEAAPTWTRVDA